MACAEKSALITRLYKKLCEFDYRGEDLRNIIMQRQKKELHYGKNTRASEVTRMGRPDLR